MGLNIYAVGGAVRDAFLGVESKDLDYAVEAESWNEMRDYILGEGFEVFLETPQYFTIRARGPKGDEHFGGKVVDFVLCRKDGGYSDGRRPDEVHVGTIFDDLARRDFTINAIARRVHTGEILDPHGGVKDIERRTIRCVGRAKDRFTEDALRALRALRFGITKDFSLDSDVLDALQSPWLPDLMVSVSKERRREELMRCFKYDTVDTLHRLHTYTSEAFRKAIFFDGLWLKPSLED